MTISPLFDADWIAKMEGIDKPNSNMQSVVLGLEKFGQEVGLHKPARLAHYLAQLSHESVGFKHDKEIWGPTPAQQRYDTRTDLGNTPEQDGDGFLFRGRTGIQITGRANVKEFRNWIWAKVDSTAPDFVLGPDKMNVDPWEGLGPIWYWHTRGLNTYADDNDIENVTRKINGGLNGYADRLLRYSYVALILLGYDRNGVMKFQQDAGLKADGIAGPKTRAALHASLERLPDFTFEQPKVEEPVSPPPPTDTIVLKPGLTADEILVAILELLQQYKGPN